MPPSLRAPSFELPAKGGCLRTQRIAHRFFAPPTFFHSVPQLECVTNNLDREFWKAQACRMRDCFPNTFISGPKSDAKSLFRNILAVSPCGSRFCPDPTLSRARKFLGMRILGEEDRKNIARDTHTNLTHPHKSRAAPGGQPGAAVPTFCVHRRRTEPNLSLALRSPAGAYWRAKGVLLYA
jgi:hypothetical protein